MGYTGVSFYIHWSLLEGEQGVFRAEGIFDLQPFFDAALEAGIYLLAVSEYHYCYEQRLTLNHTATGTIYQC